MSAVQIGDITSNQLLVKPAADERGFLLESPFMLAWLDLEMTGLDPARHAIVEIATLITDDDLQVVAEGPNLVIHQPPEVLAAMEDIVRDMHTSSGLLSRIRSSDISIADAGLETLAFLRDHIKNPKQVPMCGNSIGTDRRFLAQHLPDVDNYLSYRSIDVSTIKELAKRWDSQVYSDAPKKESRHRALDDIKESVNELRWYRQVGFVGKGKGKGKLG